MARLISQRQNGRADTGRGEQGAYGDQFLVDLWRVGDEASASASAWLTGLILPAQGDHYFGLLAP